jgi:hypothetical protein
MIGSHETFMWAAGIAEGSPCLHQPLPPPMQRLQILLCDGLDRHQAHGGTRHGFGDRFGSPQIVFVRFPIRGHKLGRHQADLVPMLPKATCPVMGTAAGFHANARRGQLAMNVITCAR